MGFTKKPRPFRMHYDKWNPKTKKMDGHVAVIVWENDKEAYGYKLVHKTNKQAIKLVENPNRGAETGKTDRPSYLEKSKTHSKLISPKRKRPGYSNRVSNNYRLHNKDEKKVDGLIKGWYPKNNQAGKGKGTKK